jgi:hypothetical protein
LIRGNPGFKPQKSSFSFSSEVRNQVASAMKLDDCCAQAALLALSSTCGGESKFLDGENFLVFSVASPAVARSLFKLVRKIFSDRPRVERQFSPKLRRKRLFRIWLRLDADDFERLASLETLKKRIRKRSCCRRSFLRGAFLGCGYMVDPERAYHLEFSAPEEMAEWISDLLEKEKIFPGCYQRSGQSNLTLYIKSSEEISSFLSVVGAHRALLQLEDVLMSKELRNNVQRVVNCETANLERTVTTAARQLEEINFLQERGILGDLAIELVETALLRIEHPYASLQELAALHDPPMSKSAINHRLRRIREISKPPLIPRGGEGENQI